MSNTYFVEKYLGWKGICVEANNALFKELIKNRACICENVCVDGKRGKVRFVNDGLFGGIIDKDTDNRDKKNEDFVEKTTVTLIDVLEKYNAPKVIDFFSLDVEGAETRIMKDFPFDRYIFLSACIERPGRLLHKIFKENKYILVNLNAVDSLYVHKSLFDTFAIGRKIKIYYVLILKSFKKDIGRIIFHASYLWTRAKRKRS